MFRLAVAGLSGAMLVACSSSDDMEDTLGVNGSPQSGESAHEILHRRVDANAVEGSVKVANETYEFNYTWPREAAAIPAFAQLLAGRVETERANFELSATLSRSDAEKEGYSYLGYQFTGDWDVAADTLRFLSLRDQRYVFSGGAHGNTDFDALVWDRDANNGAGEAFYTLDMFTAEYELSQALHKPYCEDLIVQQNERRGETPITKQEMLAACPALDELTIVAGSSDGVSINQIDLLAAPYIAGSYAEGAYEVTVPVTKAILATVKPEYRSGFSVAK